MGRYLKRAEHISRLMEIQMSALIDRPWEQIHFGWSRMFEHLKITPQHGDLNNWMGFDTQWTLTDSFALSDELTFDRANLSSILSCFERGRENARQMRHCISSEMWLGLNRSYFRVRDLSIEAIWTQDPKQFYADMVQDVNTFMGICAGTLYRDERWEFLQIGRQIEQSQLMSALMLFQARLHEDRTYGDLELYDWWSLLHGFQVDEAYQTLYGGKVDPDLVMNMLVTDSRLPNSIEFAVSQAASRLSELGDAPGQKSGALANRFAGRLISLLRYEWPDATNKIRMLNLVETLAHKLHEHISSGWFSYVVHDIHRS